MSRKKEVEKKDLTKRKLDDLKALLNNDDKENNSILPAEQVSQLEGTGLLTFQQLAFIDEYLKTFNATQSAITAGYATKGAGATASRLLSYVNVRAEIKKRQELKERSSNITREFITEKLLELIQDCYNDEKTDRTSALKAMDMLAKMNGMYSPEVQMNVQNNLSDGTININIIRPKREND